MQPINNKLINGTWIDRAGKDLQYAVLWVPRLKEQENLFQKELNIMQGLLSETA